MTQGFAPSEYLARVCALQTVMAQADIAALLLSTPADIAYLSGFVTRFWESPTRPWFLVVPVEGTPVAVIPSIGSALMQTTWIEDIRTWRAPDYEDDGVTLLAATLREQVPKGERIGVPDGNGTHLRMPLRDWASLRVEAARDFVGDAGVMAITRMVKSEAEIARISASCAVADAAFDRVQEIASRGDPLSDVFRRFQSICLEEGADHVPYLAGGAGAGGYSDVISPATDQALYTGDVLMLDTGLVKDAYFCDFDRNFSVGTPSSNVANAHGRLIEATQTAFEAARPGVTAADLFTAMDRILTGGVGGSDAGRLGHGLGLQLTEPPSLISADRTELVPGMVLTLEPGLDLGAGRIMVHEENIVIRQAGAEWLSRPAAREIRRLAA
ncbi:MAG: Xaa-Pro peptidase family protein [Pseudomonadota bacterium]